MCLNIKCSLAELNECLTEREEMGSDRKTAASTACGVTSAIPSQEIESIIEDVKELDKDTLKVN